MRRPLSKREKRLILFLALVAVVAIAGFSVAPKQSLTFEDVLAYYVNAFNGAEQITIRPAEGDGQPVTLTRDEAARLFSQLAVLARYSTMSASPSPYPPKWILDITLQDGSRIEDISVGHHLDAPKQPLRGQTWLIPRRPGESEPTPAMADAIDRHLNPGESEREQPKDTGESE